ncbi:MAG: RNA polymerase sigma factor [Deltaproteobacteria bacterium]
MRYLDRLTAIRIREGDTLAFETLIHTYQSRVFSYCLRMTDDHGAAEDLAQEVFLKVYRNIGSYDCHKAGLSTWVYAISRNTALNYLRSLERKEREVAISAEELARLASPNQTNGLEDRLRLIEALNKLDPEDRDIVLWKDYLDLRYSEIAQLLQLPVGTVKSRLFSIRRSLRRELEGMSK